MERRGSGFKKIIEDYEFQEHYTEKLKPVFYAKYDSFILTLYNLNYGMNLGDTQYIFEDGTHDGIYDKSYARGYNDLDKRIIEIIRNNSNITQNEIAKMTGVSPRTIKRHTVAIKSITYVGSGDKGHWEVKDE